jgi:hypothetical protein
VLRSFSNLRHGKFFHGGNTGSNPVGDANKTKTFRAIAASAAAANPNYQALALFPQYRQSGTVHTLCAQYIDVVKLCELLGREGFGRAEDHVTSVVDHDIALA